MTEPEDIVAINGAKPPEAERDFQWLSTGWPHARNTWTSRSVLGMDSIQGLLEVAEWYPKGGITWVASVVDRDDPYTPAGMLVQLETEGLLKMTWKDYPAPDGEPATALEKIWLTTKGHEKLHALRQQSPAGLWKSRLLSTSLTSATAVVTTLLTLQVKSCAQ